MSRTCKDEYNGPDGFHLTNKLERQARPSGADKKAFYADLALDPAFADEIDDLSQMELTPIGWV